MKTGNENTDKAFVQNWKNIDKSNFEDTVSNGGVSWYTLVGGDESTSKDLICGMATLEADGTGFLAPHRHDPAELYHILEGSGVMTIDGVEHNVSAGDCIYIPGNSEHGIVNTGSIPLRFFYVLTGDKFSDVEYRFTHEQK